MAVSLVVGNNKAYSLRVLEVGSPKTGPMRARVEVLEELCSFWGPRWGSHFCAFCSFQKPPVFGS